MTDDSVGQRRLESVRRETGQRNCVVWSRVVCAPKNRGSHNVRARKKIDPWTDLVGVYQPALDRCPDIDDRREVLLRVRQTVGVCMCADFFLASCDPPPPDTFFFFFSGSERRTCSSSASIRHRHRPSTRWLHPCLLWRGLVYSCVPALYQGSKDSGYRSRGAANSLRTTVWFEGSRANPTPSKNTCTWGGVAIIAVGELTVSGLWVPVVRCRGVRRKRTRFGLLHRLSTAVPGLLASYLLCVRACGLSSPSPFR